MNQCQVKSEATSYKELTNRLITLNSEKKGHRYQIIKTIGEGTFGVTYLAKDTQKLDNLCVIKKLKALKSSRQFTIYKKLFEREAKQLLKLGNLHERIPNFLDYFQENENYYLVQEYIEGIELTQELTPGKILSEPETIALLKSILEPLACLHKQQIVHRDIKPSNLICRQQDGEIVLIDFGAVKDLAGTKIVNEKGVSAGGTIIGTPGYMPYEQALGNPKCASDIYAVGIIGIQAITGLSGPAAQKLAQLEKGKLNWQKLAQGSSFLAVLLEKMVSHCYKERYRCEPNG